MQISLPKYSSKDYIVMPLVVLPFAFGINAVAFGAQYFSSIGYFVLTTLLSAVCFAVYFVFCGLIAVLLKERFPNQSQVTARLGIIITSFLIMSGLFLMLFYKLYASFDYFKFTFDGNLFVWSYFALGIMNIFLTFLHEGIERYDNWKAKQQETELLKANYKKSRLMGLRSQVNPHFLFNSLNSLSSLISEDEDEAEKFLNEMSKVYRYMLRGEDDTVVTLETELKFLDSYYHLLNIRFSGGLVLRREIDPKYYDYFAPALTLQIIIENAFTQNSTQKSSPLIITLKTLEDTLLVSNNLQSRKIQDDEEIELGLDNLISRYQLLGKSKVSITDENGVRVIRLPLLTQKSNFDA